MEQYVIGLITQNVYVFKIIGYYVVFFSGLFECIPFIGFIIPGQTIIMIAGFFAKKKAFSFLILIIISASGAIIGDTLSFLAGRKYGDSLLKKHGSKFYVKDHHIENTKKLIHNHPGKTLFFGRFNSITRSLAAFIAGTSKIETPVFFFYCFIGGITWATTFISIGYIFGKSFDVIGPAIGKFIFIATFIAIALIGIVQYLKKKGYNLTYYSINMLVTSIVSIYVFSTIGQTIIKKSALILYFDQKIYQFIPSIRTEFFDKFMIIFSYINTNTFLICVLILTVILLIKKRYFDASISFISLSSTTILIYFIKTAVNRIRPDNPFITSWGASFPSAHSALATLLFLIIIHTFGRTIKNHNLKLFFISINILMIIIISFSRIYLGVHFTTDVIAGIALGAFIFSITVLASKVYPWLYKKMKREQIIPNL